MNTIYKLPLVLEPQPEGGYSITCPLLPELVTEADSVGEVVPNVSDAVTAIIEAYQDLKKPLPNVLKPFMPTERVWAETFIPVPVA